MTDFSNQFKLLCSSNPEKLGSKNLIVRVSTQLECTVEAAWAEVLKPKLLLQVAAPMAIISPSRTEQFPELWQQGQTYYCKSDLHGFIPAGERSLFFERIDPVRHEIQSREQDPLAKKWDHLIRIERSPQGATVYTDEIDLDAGILTPVIWAWATLFYRHRQRKWRVLAKTLRSANQEGASP